jgi:hypothetical protein
MTELTAKQIVGIIVAVLVLAIVIFSVTTVFRERIFSFFSGLGPSEKEPDLNSAYYQDLVRDSNLVAVLSTGDSEQYIVFAGVKSKYYWSKGKVRLDVSNWFDSTVGRAGEDGKIEIDESDLQEHSELLVLQGAEKVGVGFYRRGGTR